MGGDTPLVVHLEVTVPRFVLSAFKGRPVQTESGTAGQDMESGQSAEEERELVRLLLPGQLQGASQQQQRDATPPDITVEASSRMVHSMHFRVFRVGLPALQDQAFLLQILRRCNWPNWPGRTMSGRRNNDGGDNGQRCVTDELAFSLECRRTDQVSAETTLTTSPHPHISTLMPGLNRVVILLDDEGTPCSYSIDGAES